jgi:uncharacterized protein
MKQRRKVIGIVAKLLVAGVLSFMLLRWFEHSQVYHPAKVLDGSAADLHRPFEDVVFSASDGVKLNGWFFPANTGSSKGHLAVLVCHGNAGNISHRLDLCKALLETGVSVFLFDYRGYGRSSGRPSEEGTYLDAEAAHRWLQQKGCAATNIIAYGESLGGGIASELALRAPVAALVLQSTFSCMPDIGAELFPWLPVRRICTIKYDTCTKLPRLKVPVLIMHSRIDGLIGFHHAEKNFSLANEPKLLCELTGDHNDPVNDPPNFIGGFEKLLALIEAARNAHAAGRPSTNPG